MVISLDLSSLFEDIFEEHKRKKYQNVVGFQTPTNRKTNWESAQTDLFNTLLDFYPLEFNFELPELNWSFNFTFNYLLDTFMRYQWGLSEESKAYYGKTKYGQSFYDPPNFNVEKFVRLVWDIRYKLTNYKRHDPNFTKETAKKWVEWVYETLVENGVAEHIARSIAPVIVYYEGKLLTAGYVGFGLVGYAKVMPKPSGERYYESSFLMRSTEDYYTLTSLKTITIHEPNVGMAMVGYSRVAPSTKKVKTLKSRSTYRLIDKAIADTLKENVDRGRSMFSPQEISGVKYQPITMSQIRSTTIEKKKWRGGRHQLLQQEILVRVKRILDKHGVINFFRKAYYNFALEIAYREYESRYKKKWKSALESDEYIVNKYVRQGCDEPILRKIIKTIFKIRE